MTLPSSLAPPVSVLGGQLCLRALGTGSALVGLLRLPQDFVPQEGAAYLLVDHGDRIQVSRTVVDPPPSEEDTARDIGSLLRQPIWRQTTAPEARMVRFIEAFPASNEWVVFGPSQHPLPVDAPAHCWRRADAAGNWGDIEAPVDACRLALSQLLTTPPIWPAADGELYALSALPTFWRGHYHRYHQLLAQSTRDPDLDARLETVLREDPHLSQIAYGRVDRDYCAFLAAMEDRGALTPDAPRRAAEVNAREEQATAQSLQVVTDSRAKALGDLATALNMERPRPRRSP